MSFANQHTCLRRAASAMKRIVDGHAARGGEGSMR